MTQIEPRSLAEIEQDIQQVQLERKQLQQKLKSLCSEFLHCQAYVEKQALYSRYNVFQFIEKHKELHFFPQLFDLSIIQDYFVVPDHLFSNRSRRKVYYWLLKPTTKLITLKVTIYGRSHYYEWVSYQAGREVPYHATRIFSRPNDITYLNQLMWKFPLDPKPKKRRLSWKNLWRRDPHYHQRMYLWQHHSSLLKQMQTENQMDLWPKFFPDLIDSLAAFTIYFNHQLNGELLPRRDIFGGYQIPHWLGERKGELNWYYKPRFENSPRLPALFQDPDNHKLGEAVKTLLDPTRLAGHSEDTKLPVLVMPQEKSETNPIAEFWTETHDFYEQTAAPKFSNIADEAKRTWASLQNQWSKLPSFHSNSANQLEDNDKPKDM